MANRTWERRATVSKRAKAVEREHQVLRALQERAQGSGQRSTGFLASLTTMTDAQAYRALRRLEAVGIVSRQRVGRRVYWRVK